MPELWVHKLSKGNVSVTGMFSWRYVVSGDPDAARAAVRGALEQQQFSVDESSPEAWHATQAAPEVSFFERLTSNPHGAVALTVKYDAEPSGLVVSLHRPAFGGTGGFTRNSTELASLDKAYRAAAAAVHQALSAAGILVSASE